MLKLTKMPQRKKNTTLVTEDALVEAVVERVTDQFNQQLDARFARLELVIGRGAAPDVTTTPIDVPAPNRNDKRPAENTTEEEAPAPKRPTQLSVSENYEPSLSSILKTGDTRHIDSGRTLRPDSQQPLRSAMMGHETVSASGVNNNNNTWKAWQALTERAPPHHQPTAGNRLQSFEHSAFYDHDIDAQVRHILDVTPHQLKGNVPTGVYPFKYVTRGPDKKKLSFNTLSLPEHALGIFRILEDDRVDPSIKPELLAHMKEVVEDSCEFDWGGHVRRWSEEVFDLVAEGRLPGGWSAHSKIQNLRTGMSRVDSARLGAPWDNPPYNTNRKPAATSSQNETFRPSHQSEIFKGGPPCTQFNSVQGCHLPSGHIANGKKQIHVCSYCLINTAAAHPHSEAHCRTKQRHASHFSVKAELASALIISMMLFLLKLYQHFRTRPRSRFRT